jgi:hypothetical protein
MANINLNDPTEKRISLVYNSDISGFQALDFSKIDGIESLLTSGISVTANVTTKSWIDSSQTQRSSQFIAVGGFDGANDQIAPIPLTDGGEYVLVNGTVAVGNSVTISSLPAISGTVTTIQEKSSNISNFTPSGTNGTVLAANSNRKELFVQNLQSGNLYVKYGASANSNSFNFILTSGSAAGAGDGGSLSDLNYIGVVSVSGESPNYICWERS